MDESGKKKKSPLRIIVIVLFLLLVSCASIGYVTKASRIDEEPKDKPVPKKDINELGSNTNILKVKFDYKDNYYGCNDNGCNKLSLDVNNYNLNVETNITYDNNSIGKKLKAYIKDNSFYMEKGNRTLNLTSINNPISINVTGDKNTKNHYVYILNGEGALYKINDSVFDELSTGSGTIDTERISVENISKFNASYFINDSDKPTVDLVVVDKENKSYYLIQNKIYEFNKLVERTRFNSDFVLLNMNISEDKDYNYLKYNGEVIEGNSIFYKDEQVIIIDTKNNIYNITQNKINKYKDKKVTDISTDENKIYVTYENDEKEEFDFSLDKLNYINNIMYTRFIREE